MNSSDKQTVRISNESYSLQTSALIRASCVCLGLVSMGLINFEVLAQSASSDATVLEETSLAWNGFR